MFDMVNVCGTGIFLQLGDFGHSLKVERGLGGLEVFDVNLFSCFLLYYALGFQQLVGRIACFGDQETGN